MYPALQLWVSFFSVLDSIKGNVIPTLMPLFLSFTYISCQTETYFPNYHISALR